MMVERLPPPAVGTEGAAGQRHECQRQTVREGRAGVVSGVGRDVLQRDSGGRRLIVEEYALEVFAFVSTNGRGARTAVRLNTRGRRRTSRYIAPATDADNAPHARSCLCNVIALEVRTIREIKHDGLRLAVRAVVAPFGSAIVI
jgi:hypothetical protein